MKHIMMGLKFVGFFLLFVLCVGTLLTAIGVLKVFCGANVAIGVFIALALFAFGFMHSYDGGYMQ